MFNAWLWNDKEDPRNKKRQKKEIKLSRSEKKRGTTYKSGMSMYLQPVELCNKRQKTSNLVASRNGSKKKTFSRISSFAKISGKVVNRQIYNVNGK